MCPPIAHRKSPSHWLMLMMIASLSVRCWAVPGLQQRLLVLNGTQLRSLRELPMLSGVLKPSWRGGEAALVCPRNQVWYER